MLNPGPLPQIPEGTLISILHMFMYLRNHTVYILMYVKEARLNAPASPRARLLPQAGFLLDDGFAIFIECSQITALIAASVIESDTSM